MARKDLDADAIGTLVDQKIAVSSGIYNSRLSKERELVNRYYNSEYPKRSSKGSSSYVSTDVYDATESMKAQLLETFAGGVNIIKFSPQHSKDVEAARIATAYTNYVLFQQNDGYGIFHDVIDDGLKARVGIVKVFWEECKEDKEETFEGLSFEEVQGLTAQEDVAELDADFDEDTQTYKGTLTRTVDKSQVCIETVPPEEFGIEPYAAKLEGSFCYHRTLKTKSELKEEGFDVRKLKGVMPDGDSIDLNQVEKDARFEKTDTGFRPGDDDVDPENTPYVVYECYMKMVARKGDRKRLWKIVRVAGVTLDIQEVDRYPFIFYRPLRVGHSFLGNNYASRVIPTQNARTVLTRSILDHTAITTNPRYTVLQGGLTNPREMLDNRLGGLVNVTRPDAVNPLLQQPLNPFVFQTLEMLKVNNEESTGITALAQGLDKDAISNQNSRGMVSDLVNLSQIRQKVIARNFVNDFLIPLYIEIYRLVIENENRQSVLEVAGNWVQINPKTWIERKDTTVQLLLGPGAADAEAMQMAQLLAMATGDPDLNAMVGKRGKYRMATDIMNLKGKQNVNDYITPPEQLPPPQPNPAVIQEMQLREREMKVQEQEVALKTMKAQSEDRMDQFNQQLEQMRFMLEKVLKMDDSRRKDMETANRIDVAQRELKIVEEAPEGELNAVAQPSG